MKHLLLAMTLALGGCGAVGAVDISGIKEPPRRYMRAAKRCPAPPPEAKMNRAARDHTAGLTTACAANKTSTRGLQRYARALTQ